MLRFIKHLKWACLTYHLKVNSTADCLRLMHEILSIQDQLEVASLAIFFFSPMNCEKVVSLTNAKPTEGVTTLFAVSDFLKFLERSELLKDPRKYGACISEILRKLATANILKLMGVRGPIFGEQYYCILFKGDKEKDFRGRYWQAAALGAAHIYHFFTPYIVQITGTNKDGTVQAGTGILIRSNRVLTCAHVLTDMKVDDSLVINGQKKQILDQRFHETVDVGFLDIEELAEFHEHQIMFANPEILDEVYLMGFPKVPQIREAPLTIQKGEVNNTNSTTFEGSKVFLFSAVARPGNSGGPIISRRGNIVGIVTRDLFALTEETEKKNVLPFYAGIPSSQISAALHEIDEGAVLPT